MQEQTVRPVSDPALRAEVSSRLRDIQREIASLTDEHGVAVQSEKMLEIDFSGTQPIRAGDQFGIGRKLKP